MQYLEQTWRWFGPSDPVPLAHVRMAGATGIVTSLHHLPNGAVWSNNEILKRKKEIEAAGLSWSVVESIPVHEDIKKRSGNYRQYIDNYKITLRNLSQCGIDIVCYNFMPVLDWTRTHLTYEMPDGAKALKFSIVDLAVFDLYILKRYGAEDSYSKDIRVKAKERMYQLSETERSILVRNIIAGLPGSDEGYSLNQFQDMLNTYASIGEDELRMNLFHFLREIIPVAEEAGIAMTIHPDDPPFPILGLPRVVSTLEDAKQIIQYVDSPSNGICFCTGSYGAREDNDLVAMIKQLGHRINFIHLRNVRRDEFGFYEADHLNGDVNMFRAMEALISEQKRRIERGEKYFRMPFRPDHGHQMLDDLFKETNPGYSAIGRLRGLAELRGLELGIRNIVSGL